MDADQRLLTANDSRPVEAVIFDLDDTLYDQREYLAGAWEAVAEAAGEQGADSGSLLICLNEVADEGSGRGKIIDRALLRCGAKNIEVAPLVATFLDYRPERLSFFPGVATMLAELNQAAIPVAVVTDGALATQEAKIAALGLRKYVNVIVMSDSFGREFRKPHPRPMLAALAGLGVAAGSAVVVGDRPDKDVAAATAAGIRAIRVRTGEYATAADEPGTWRRAQTAVAAIDDLIVAGLLVSSVRSWS